MFSNEKNYRYESRHYNNEADRQLLGILKAIPTGPVVARAPRAHATDRDIQNGAERIK